MSIDRRHFMAGGAAVATSAFGMPAASAKTNYSEADYYAGTLSDNGFDFRRTNMKIIEPRWHRQLVKFEHKEPPGVVIVDTQNHFLYLTFENDTALRYGIGVGKEGFQWFGRAQVMRKALWPGWTPPPEMLLRRPELPRHMVGGPDNPLGPRAMYLYRDGRDLDYRIHATLEPWSIGEDVSSGCIRLLPEEVIDLFQRVPVGTYVEVMKHLT